MTRETQFDQIATYLRKAFPGSHMERSSHTLTHETILTLRQRDSTYTLRIDPGFTDTYNEFQIPDLLSQWDVAAELRRAEGLPLVLTASGARLASSN
jgi:hypothetical protein